MYLTTLKLLRMLANVQQTLKLSTTEDCGIGLCKVWTTLKHMIENHQGHLGKTGKNEKITADEGAGCLLPTMLSSGSGCCSALS